MKRKEQKPKTLQEAIQYFSDEQVCIDTVAKLRWPDGVVTCPSCEGKEHYYLASQKRWKCKECGRQFSVKLGTIFEDSPISLCKWLAALWMLVNCKNGVSSYEVGRALGVTQKSAWFMMHRLRLALRNGSLEKFGSGEGGEVEVDESYVGPNPKNMHKERKLRYNQQRNATGHGKAIVMGILDRESREVRAKVVPNAKRETLQSEILKNVRHGSRVYTDEAVAYNTLWANYIHRVVNHAEEYVKGSVHTNGLENFWSLMKRNLRGTYVAVEPFHLDRYLDEQMFRYNNRGSKDAKVTDADRFDLALKQIGGKRLTFAEVTGKNA